MFYIYILYKYTHTYHTLILPGFISIWEKNEVTSMVK